MNNKQSASFWLATLLTLVPAASRADLKSDLLAIEKEMWIAWGKKDAAPYSKYLDADYRFIAENMSPIDGKEANIKALTSHSCELGGISFEDVSMRQLGSSVAVIGYTAVADIRCGERRETVKLATTSVWHERNGAWTTSNYHQSLINN